jgi:hypothetical protein
VDAAARGPLAHLPTYYLLLLPYLTSIPRPTSEAPECVDREPATPSKVHHQRVTKTSRRRSSIARDIFIVALYRPTSPRTEAPGLAFCSSGRLPQRPLEPVEPKLAKPTAAWAEVAPNLAETHNSHPNGRSLARASATPVDGRLLAHAPASTASSKGPCWRRLTAAHPSTSPVDPLDNGLLHRTAAKTVRCLFHLRPLPASVSSPDCVNAQANYPSTCPTTVTILGELLNGRHNNGVTAKRTTTSEMPPSPTSSAPLPRQGDHRP